MILIVAFIVWRGDVIVHQTCGW